VAAFLCLIVAHLLCPTSLIPSRQTAENGCGLFYSISWRLKSAARAAAPENPAAQMCVRGAAAGRVRWRPLRPLPFAENGGGQCDLIARGKKAFHRLFDKFPRQSALEEPSRNRRGPRRESERHCRPGNCGAPIVEIAEFQKSGAGFGNRLIVIALRRRRTASSPAVSGAPVNSAKAAQTRSAGGCGVTSCGRNGRSRNRRPARGIAYRFRPGRGLTARASEVLLAANDSSDMSAVD